jgi:hypothetical protein
MNVHAVTFSVNILFLTSQSGMLPRMFTRAYYRNMRVNIPRSSPLPAHTTKPRRQ